MAAAFGVDGVGFPLDGRSFRAIAARIACLSSSSTFASVFDDDDDEVVELEGVRRDAVLREPFGELLAHEGGIARWKGIGTDLRETSESRT